MQNLECCKAAILNRDPRWRRSADPIVGNRCEQGSATALHTGRLAAAAKAARIAAKQADRRIAMDAVTPQGAQTADTHSHLVRPDGMEWQKTRFPGCEAKTLLFDRKTGLMTALMKFAPGAVLPDHEHVNIEQTYVLEGSLVDKEGPAQGIECKAGEFIWREEGSRHVAWCPQGGLMLAIFQVPNKFFEADGRVIDAAGEDWDASWGHTRKG
jgi:anti-sigma factor ChrR (cupin superfamily)